MASLTDTSSDPPDEDQVDEPLDYLLHELSRQYERAKDQLEVHQAHTIEDTKRNNALRANTSAYEKLKELEVRRDGLKQSDGDGAGLALDLDDARQEIRYRIARINKGKKS